MEQIYISKIKVGLFLLMFTLLGSSVYSQLEGEVIPFTRTFPGPGDSPVIRGDMKVIGNSVLGILDRIDGVDLEANDEYNGANRNNGVFRGYIDIDSDPSFNTVFTSILPISETDYRDASGASNNINIYGSPTNASLSDTGTFSSSAAELLINNPLSPAGENCSTVVKAFLYWGAMYEKESLARGTNDGPDIERPDCTRPNGDPCELFTDIKILPPGATEYVDIKHNNSGADYTSLSSRVIIDGVAGSAYPLPQGDLEVRDETYACVSDVTSLFTHLQDTGETVEGNWTVANVRAVTGQKGSGSGGGWSLVVVYEDPLATFQKNISMFEGYVAITQPNGAGAPDFAAVGFNITGFETIPAGQVNVDLATISLEGDIGIRGDEFQILPDGGNPANENEWIGMTYPGQDATNFFDCSIYSKGPITRFPNSSNTLGYDSDHFALDNSGNQYITNGDNEADFRIYTEGDAYGNFFNAFAIDVIAPDLQVIKQGFRPDASQFSATDEVDLGDQILYRITITNNGNDDAVDITFVDILPINTVFQNNIMLEGNVVPAADITIIDTTAIDSLTGLEFDTQQITFNIPDSLLEIADSVEITFSVNVVSDCSQLQDVCTNRIQNQADVSYFGEVNDNNGTKYQVQSAFETTTCGPGEEAPTVILSDQSECDTAEPVTISQCTDIVELTGGREFEEYRWFFGTTRLTTDANGDAIDPGSNTILVNQAGTYTLEAIKSTDASYLNCRDVTTTFNVVIFDSLDPQNNPFVDLGEPLDPVCADDLTEIIGIQICNDPIEITTDFPDGTIYSWQRFDPTLGCAEPTQNCPYTDAVINCYTEEPNGDGASFILENEGSYKLTVTVTGGCQVDYFFDAIPIDIDPDINVAGNVCDDNAVFTVTGVNLTPPDDVDGDGIPDGVTYTLEFEIMNNGTTQTVSPDAGTVDRYTLPRVAGESYLVKGIVTPNIAGSCSFETDEELFEFIDLDATMTVLTQATCAFDSDTTDTFDPRVAEFSVTATANFPTYVFNLIDTQGTTATGDDTTVSASSVQADNSFTFTGVNPENAANYVVEVFAGGSTTSANCTFILPVEELDVPINFSATPEIIKDLTCEPAEYRVDINLISLGTTTDPNPNFTYTIPEIPGNIYIATDILYFDDITNRPTSADEDDITVTAIDGRAINYFDFSTPTTLTIRVIAPSLSGSGGCILEREITINPYDLPTITVVSSTDDHNLDCDGDTDGLIEVLAQNGSGPGATTINNGSYELIFGGSVIRTQTTPVFTGLPEGDYTVRINNIDSCTAEVMQSISAPEQLIAPVISAPAFVCDGETVAITITTDATDGTTPYTYELLKDGNLDKIYDAATEITADTFTEGIYQLLVIDDNDCEILSNEITIQNLALTLSNTTPVLQCGINPDPEAQVTVSTSFSVANADTVLSYTISSSTNTTLTGTTNVNGVFTLTAGTHIIEVETATFGCNETIEIIIDEIDEISVFTEDDFICPGEDGQLTFAITDFGNDYQYTLESTDAIGFTNISVTNETITPLVIGSLPFGNYTFTVMDNDTQCSVVENVAIIEQPVLLDPVADINSSCFDDQVTVTVNPTDGNISSYEYSFGDDASFPATPIYQDSNSITFVPTATSTTYRYLVRNRLTTCTERGTLTITQPEELVLVSANPTNVKCDSDDGDPFTNGQTDGSYSFELSGGIVGDTYTFTLYEEDDLALATPLDVISATKALSINMADIFMPIEPGSYRVVVTDTTGCTYPLDIMLFDILPSPNLGDSSTFIVSSCLGKVTLFFEIEDGTGSPDGDVFTIADNISAATVDFVDPTASTADNIFQYDDPDFPAGYTLGTFDTNNETNRRIFAVTNLDFDITGDFIVILDTLTGCKYVVEYDTDASPSFVVTATPVSAGACDLITSGLVDLEIENITGGSTIVDIEIFRVGGDGTILANVPNVNLAAGNNTIPQISGLPTGNLRVRVQDQANDCNGTADFLIEIADPLGLPLFTEVLEDCDDQARLVNLSGTGGNLPYRFAVSLFGTSMPAEATFLEIDFLDETNSTLPTLTDVNGDIDATLWILDLNGCSNSVRVQMQDYVLFAPDPANLETTNNCVTNEGPRVTITDTSTWLGRLPYSYMVVGQGNDFTEIGTLPFTILLPDEGNYDIIFTDGIDCPVTLPVVIPTADFELDTPNYTPLSCTENGVVSVEIIAGGQPTDIYSFEISQFEDTAGVITTPNTASDNSPLAAGVFTDNFTVTEAGLYQFRVTNNTTQCEFFITQNVEEPLQIRLDAPDFLLDCSDSMDGEIVFEIFDFEGDVAYEVLDSSTASVATGTINAYADPSASTSVTTGNISSIDSSTGIVTISDFVSGTYTLRLTAGMSGDSFCTISEEVLIDAPEVLTVSLIEISPVTCRVDSSAILRASAQGGTSPYTYELFIGTTMLASNDTGIFDEDIIDTDGNSQTSDVYFVRVTDSSTVCTIDSAPVPVSLPESVVISSTTTQIVCAGESGSFTVIPSYPSGNTDFSNLTYAMFAFDATAAPDFKGIQIIASQQSPIINNVFAGEYVIEATDIFGCTSNLEFPIMPELTPVEFEDNILVRGVSCNPTNEQYELYASGGTGNHIFQEYTDATRLIPRNGPSALIPEGSPYIYNTNNGGTTEAFTVYFSVVDENGCENFTQFSVNPVPEPVDFTLQPTETVCFGESGGRIDLSTLTGGIGNFVYNIYDSQTSTTPLTSPTVNRIVPNGSAFDALPAGIYWYEVSSGTGEGTCTLRQQFTITQHPELILEYIINSGIGCPGEDDAIVRLKVDDEDLLGNPSGIGPFVYQIAKDGVFLTSETIDDNTTEAVFEFLGPGNYTYFIADNGTGCTGPTGNFVIESKEFLQVVLEPTLSDDLTSLCKGETDGVRAYTISGGTPPYFAVLLDDPTLPEPVAEDVILADPIVTNNPFFIAGSDATDAIDGVVYTTTPVLATDVPYRLFIFDSGNGGLTADNLRTCEAQLFEFEFETEDLDDFDVEATPNCDTLDYTISIDNNSDLNDEDLLIRVFTRNTDGSDGAPAGNLRIGETLIQEGVPPGEYNVYLESLLTGCATIIEERQEWNLEPFSSVQFITLDDQGNEVQPFRTTNEINIYQLQVTGGVNPNGVNPYTYSATFVPLNSGLSGGVVEVDNEGFFEIEEPGFYTFRVVDNYGDNGVTCFDLSNSIGLNTIDIDIPNVFNPSSSDPLTNTWFPENLTTAFTSEISPIIDPEGDGEPSIPGIVTTTNSEVEGGTISGGTTSGGVINGGTVTGGNTPVTIPNSVPTGSSSTVTTVTTGGTIDESGNIIGGTTIITTTTGVNVTTVEIVTGATVTGGTTDSSGITSGGTVTGGTRQTATPGPTVGGITTYTIVTGGTITGGTTTGTTTTGGTTVFSNTTTGVSGNGSFVTTDGISTGGITTGANTSDGFITTISVPVSGASAPTIQVATGVSVTNGTVTGATITGGTVIGGTVTGGERTTEEIEFLDYENMQVFVFDRYGRLLKEIKGIQQKTQANADGWDGTYQGNNMPSGDYWYLIQLNDPQGREFTGHFTLYRR